MITYVLDACAIIAFLAGELGGAVVAQILSDPNSRCVIHAVNLCEVYYDAVRKTDIPTARQDMAALLSGGLSVRADLDTPFWQKVGELKVSPGRLSLADCFALALAQTTGGTLATSDHHEFDPVVPLNLCPILFIR
jgi:PIN domain nuclease of toxin-antitoxin system